MKYIIVTEMDKSLFISRINERMDQGYVPQGGPFMSTTLIKYFPTQETSTEYNQAMIHPSLLPGDRL